MSTLHSNTASLSSSRFCQLIQLILMVSDYGLRKRCPVRTDLIAAPTEGIRRVLEIGYEEEIPRGEPLDLSGVIVIRMGTTVVSPFLSGDRQLTCTGYKCLAGAQR